MVLNDEHVLADTRHWIEKVVIGLNLCPFARAVYVKNQVRIVVSRARHLDAFLDELDAELELLKTTPAEQIDTTLLVHPSLFPDFAVFNDFLGVVDFAWLYPVRFDLGLMLPIARALVSAGAPVLNIFLQLLNLIFFWLPFLKICLPVPKAKD